MPIIRNSVSSILFFNHKNFYGVHSIRAVNMMNINFTWDSIFPHKMMTYSHAWNSMCAVKQHCLWLILVTLWWFDLQKAGYKIGGIMLFYLNGWISQWHTTVYHRYILHKILSFTKILIKLHPLSINRASLILVLTY